MLHGRKKIVSYPDFMWYEEKVAELLQSFLVSKKLFYSGFQTVSTFDSFPE